MSETKAVKSKTLADLTIKQLGGVDKVLYRGATGIKVNLIDIRTLSITLISGRQLLVKTDAKCTLSKTTLTIDD